MDADDRHIGLSFSCSRSLSVSIRCPFVNNLDNNISAPTGFFIGSAHNDSGCPKLSGFLSEASAVTINGLRGIVRYQTVVEAPGSYSAD